MQVRNHQLFLGLVIVQAFHSTEEYHGRLWDVLPPARFLCSLVSNDRHTGFLIINIGLFVMGMLGWAFIVRPQRLVAPVLMWFWVIIETINGIGHPVWTLMEGGYTPGVITALLLLPLALVLGYRLIKSENGLT